MNGTCELKPTPAKLFHCDRQEFSTSLQMSRTQPRSQRCAGSASSRGCQSSETVTSGGETGSGKLCMPARRFPVCRSGTQAIRSEARASARALEKPPTIVLSEQQKRSRRARSIAIALALGALVILFYVVTLVKGPGVLNRPL